MVVKSTKKTKKTKKTPKHIGQAQTSVQHADGSEENTSEQIGGDLSPLKKMAEPRLNLGVTLNVGNYQSVRIDVGLRVPCEIEEIGSVYEFILEWVDERMTKLQKDVKVAYGLEQPKID